MSMANWSQNMRGCGDGESVLWVATVEIPANDLPRIRPPEAVLPGEMVVIDLDKGLEMLLYAMVVIVNFYLRQL